MKSRFDRLIELNKQQRSIDRDISKEIKRIFKVGDIIMFNKGGRNHEGEITRVHDQFQRIKIRNIYTDKEYWIDVYHVLEAHGLGGF